MRVQLAVAASALDRSDIDFRFQFQYEPSVSGRMGGGEQEKAS